MICRLASTLCLLLSVAACGDSVEAPTSAPTDAGWRAPPRVERVTSEGGRLLLSGFAQPGARVVMRDGSGQAHAATAGPDGDFTLSMAASPSAVLLRPEDQDGQRSVPGPDAVLMLPDGAAVALSPGGPSRRLDAGDGLSAVDSDGRMAIVSGRAGAGQKRVRVRLGTGAEMDAPVDARGVWTMRTDLSALSGGLQVDGVEHRPRLETVAPGTISADQDGVLIGWAAPDGAVLSTWIPAR